MFKTSVCGTLTQDQDDVIIEPVQWIGEVRDQKNKYLTLITIVDRVSHPYS